MIRLIFAMVLGLAATLSAQAQSLGESFRAYQAAIEEGELEAAREHARRVYDLTREGQAGEATVAAAAFNLGKLEARLDNREAAASLLEEAVDLTEDAYGDDDARLVDPLWELANVKTARSEARRAAKLYSRIVDLLEAASDPNPEMVFQARIDHAWSLVRSGRHSPGASKLRDIRRDLEEADFPRAEFYRGLASFNIGKIEMARKDYDDAAEALSQAIDDLTRTADESTSVVLSARAFLVEALERDGRSEEATEHCIAIGRARTDREISEFMPIFRVMPAYPRRAARSNVQGSVIVALTVTPTGHPKDITVVGGKNAPYFEDSALDAARQFRYAPRIENGEPVETPGVEYVFSYAIR